MRCISRNRKSIADAKRYQTKMEAEANRELLTQEYIELRRAMSIANNTKIYFGSDIPSMFLGSNNGGAVSPAAANFMYFFAVFCCV